MTEPLVASAMAERSHDGGYREAADGSEGGGPHVERPLRVRTPLFALAGVSPSVVTRQRRRRMLRIVIVCLVWLASICAWRAWPAPSRHLDPERCLVGGS